MGGWIDRGLSGGEGRLYVGLAAGFSWLGGYEQSRCINMHVCVCVCMYVCIPVLQRVCRSIGRGVALAWRLWGWAGRGVASPASWNSCSIVRGICPYRSNPHDGPQYLVVWLSMRTRDSFA